MLDEKTRALLGDHEAAKRLTDAGVLVPCPFCKGDGEMGGAERWQYIRLTETN